MPPRKRRHEQAFSEHEESVPDEQDEELKAKAKADKEQEVWDAIREAHYEAIEQLPLTLQRQLSLMRQLDEQTISGRARLLPALQRYIRLRQELAGRLPPVSDSNDVGQPEQPAASPTSERAAAPAETQPNGQSNGKTNDALLTPSRRLRSTGDILPSIKTRTPTPVFLPSERSKPVSASREQVTQVAWMVEELLRASQEKVNLAQTNYDSVERHIQLLDQAIKEQEVSLSSDPSKPSASIHLPELLIPRWKPKPRDSEPFKNDEYDGALNEQTSAFVVEEAEPSKESSKKKGKNGSDRRKGERGNDSNSLTITLPAVQPQEELYCYCNRVSFGEMIACDNISCEREWFHLGCVGLTEPEEGEWFCEDCRGDDET